MIMENELDLIIRLSLWKVLEMKQVFNNVFECK
jgi:hypothetical protein